MCSKPENTYQPDSRGIPSTVSSHPWWHSAGGNGAPPGALGDIASRTSESPDSDMENRSNNSQGDGGREGVGVSKELRVTVAAQSGTNGTYGPEHQHMQQVASIIPPAGGEHGVPSQQPELVSHAIACAPYPYADPYYGGLMTAYGTQALVNPHVLGMHHTRMPLSLPMAEEPVYVNAKQYHGIIRRRESRAKAELEKKLIKVRKPYLHESRHQHAMRRARGCGGRFLNTKKGQSDGGNRTPEKGSGAAAPNTESSGLSGSESNPSAFTGKMSLSVRQAMHEPPHACSNGDGISNSSYEHHQGFRMSSYERGEEGDCSGQQRGSISVRQARHRALTIQ